MSDAVPFVGWILSTGTTSGVRVVLGSWDDGPLGRVDDVMVERADGRRVLYATTAALADEIGERYTFDEVVVQPVRVDRGDVWRVRSDAVELDLRIGRRTALGAALRLVPPGLRDREAWARVCDPAARLLVPGVRTHVRTGDLRLWYAARDVRRVTAVRGRVDGVDVGGLAPLRPPVRFGGSSAPPSPSLTRVTSHRRG